MQELGARAMTRENISSKQYRFCVCVFVSSCLVCFRVFVFSASLG